MTNLDPEYIRTLCVEMAVAWYTNEKTGYMIPKRRSRYEALLNKYNVDSAGDIPDDKAQRFYEQLNELIHGA